MNNWKLKFKSRIIYNSTKKHERLRDKSNKIVQNLYPAKYKAELRKTKELNKCIEFQRVRIFNIVRYQFLPLAKEIYRFNTFPINISAYFFIGIIKLIPKFIWKRKRPRTIYFPISHHQNSYTHLMG